MRFISNRLRIGNAWSGDLHGPICLVPPSVVAVNLLAGTTITGIPAVMQDQGGGTISGYYRWVVGGIVQTKGVAAYLIKGADAGKSLVWQNYAIETGGSKPGRLIEAISVGIARDPTGSQSFDPAHFDPAHFEI
jgi:hypothetical protein